MHGDQWTESLLAQQIDRPRYEQNLNRGLSFRTIVAFGKNAVKSYYYPSNASDAEITNQNLLLIDSGGQYLDGTTSIARTIHLGKPTNEQKRAYTNVLMGLIRLSMLAFPEHLKPAEIDALIREPLWSAKQDYPYLSGSGIGSYSSVEECKCNNYCGRGEMIINFERLIPHGLN
jgi:Xaa-Pro aminopeptidase